MRGWRLTNTLSQTPFIRMFEHSLYEPEPVITPQTEGDLFYGYEVRNWDIGPRIYKILGISAAANLLVFAIIATTPVLTMKGCDSPLVGGVCQVLDTLYVGSQIFGTERDYVDAVYDKTKIGDSEEVTFVDVSGITPPLSYPEGYFQVANPEQYQAMLAMQNDPNGGIVSSGIPGIPNGIPMTTPSQGNSLFNTKPKLPKTNPNAIEGELPGSIGETVAGTKKPGKGDKGPLSGSPTPSPSPDAMPTPMSADAINSVQINKKPLTEFADGIVDQWASKKVDLNKDFSITLNGVITDDGKLDPKKSKWDTTKQTGDQQMIDIGKSAFDALGQSGYLTYLKSAGVDQITAVLTQDDEKITVLISSKQKTLERANTIAGIVSVALTAGRLKVANPSDEQIGTAHV